MKIQTKTIILFLSAFLSIILMFSGFIYYSLSNYSYEDFNKLLEIRALTVAKSELDENSTSAARDFREEFFEKLHHEQDYFFPIDAEIALSTYAAQLNVPESFLTEIIENEKADYRRGSIYSKGIRYSSLKGDYIVIASAENYFESHHTAYVKRIMIFAVCMSFLFSLIISLYFSNYVFMPIRKITERAKQISSENLHLRLDLKNVHDELYELGVTFNDMLNRIETSFETQNNFVSNASHELRTPLTAIIGEADVTLSKLRKPEEYIETISIILDEAEKLDKKTQALLFLAQTGFNGKIQKFEKVRIDQLVIDVKTTIEKINVKNQVHLDFSMLPENPLKLKVRGNEQLLHLAITNIINNGCKYSNYKPVDVSIGASDHHVFVVVKDHGIGIPADELQYIYDPFFRASNTRNYEGYGIGLPLARNIIRMHNGDIIFRSKVCEGTVVQINLPIGFFEI